MLEALSEVKTKFGELTDGGTKTLKVTMPSEAYDLLKRSVYFVKMPDDAELEENIRGKNVYALVAVERGKEWKVEKMPQCKKCVPVVGGGAYCSVCGRDLI